MSTNRKAAAELELRPLEDDQLEMAHAVDAIDQSLSKAGLTWSWLAEIVAVAQRAPVLLHVGARLSSVTRRAVEPYSLR
jgi:hypothetical protein